ncbi:MAG: hypothetical protein ACOCRK_06050 [bacterium]
MLELMILTLITLLIGVSWVWLFNLSPFTVSLAISSIIWLFTTTFVFIVFLVMFYLVLNLIYQSKKIIMERISLIKKLMG